MNQAAAEGGGGGTPQADVDPSGLINPALFPKINSSKVWDAAFDIRQMGNSVRMDTQELNTEWKKLRDCYESPEQEQVYAIMDPAEKAGGEIGDNFGKCADALETYAKALEDIEPDLKQVTSDATAFRERAVKGYDKDTSVMWVIPTGSKHVPWQQYPPAVDRNTELIRQFNKVMERVSTAETDCATTINALIKDPANKIKVHEKITHEQLDHSTELPWGHQVEKEASNCGESFTYGLEDFGMGFVHGVGGLIGYDPVTDEWSWDTAGKSWAGLGNLAGSLLVLATPLPAVTQAMEAAGIHNDFTNFVDDRGKVVATTAASIVNIDLNAKDPFHKWKEDGVRSGTSALANVGSFFIPGADVGSALSLTGKGAKAASFLSKGADMAVPGLTALTKFGIETFRFGSKTDELANAAKVVDGLGGLGKAGDVAGDLSKASEAANAGAKGVSVVDDVAKVDGLGSGLGKSSEGSSVANHLGDAPKLPEQPAASAAKADAAPHTAPEKPGSGPLDAPQKPGVEAPGAPEKPQAPTPEPSKPAEGAKPEPSKGHEPEASKAHEPEAPKPAEESSKPAESHAEGAKPEPSKVHEPEASKPAEESSKPAESHAEGAKPEPSKGHEPEASKTTAAQEPAAHHEAGQHGSDPAPDRPQSSHEGTGPAGEPDSVGAAPDRSGPPEGLHHSSLIPGTDANPHQPVTHPPETVELTTKKADSNRYVEAQVTTEPIGTGPHELHGQQSRVEFHEDNPKIWNEKVRGVDGRGIHAEDLSQAALDKVNPDLERLKQNHKDWDFAGGVDGNQPKVVSTKSIDVELPSYADRPNAVYRMIDDWATKVETASGGLGADVRVVTESGRPALLESPTRELNVVLPEVKLTQATVDAVNRAVAAHPNILFSFTKIMR